MLIVASVAASPVDAVVVGATTVCPDAYGMGRSPDHHHQLSSVLT